MSLLSKYMAAAKTPNMASKIGEVARPVSRPGVGRHATGAKVNMSPKGPRPQGSTAGLKAGNSTYIEGNNSGYNAARPAPKRQNSPSKPEVYQPRLPARQRITDTTKSDWHGLRADRDLSRMV